MKTPGMNFEITEQKYTGPPTMDNFYYFGYLSTSNFHLGRGLCTLYPFFIAPLELLCRVLDRIFLPLSVMNKIAKYYKLV